MRNTPFEKYYGRIGLSETGSGVKALLGLCNDTPVWADFAQGLNFLVAGATGTGKTTFVKSVLAILMKQYTPHDLRLILYDWKAVDYRDASQGNYALLPLISKESEMLATLRWLDAEADHRLKLKADKEQCKYWLSVPHLLLVMDDFAGITGKEAHRILQKLLRMGREIKIYSILVTSTPAESVVESELRANLTHRVAFYTPEKVISRMIIEQNGAETLRVPGEMLYKAYGTLVRCDAVNVDDAEIREIVEAKQLTYPEIAAESKQKMADWIYRDFSREPDEDNSTAGAQAEQNAELLAEAGRYLIERNNATIGLLQRRFRINFNEASAIMDELCRRGVISNPEGTKPRKILMSGVEFEEYVKQELG